MGSILATTADIVRRAAIAAQPFVPASAAKMLDLLAVPADERLLQHALDPDSGIRRRHAIAARPSRCSRNSSRPRRPADVLIDSHCHLDFPDLAADRAGVLARARENGIGAHGDDFDPRRALRRNRGHRRSASGSVVLGRHPPAPRAGGTAYRDRRSRSAGRPSALRRHRRGRPRLSLRRRLRRPRRRAFAATSRRRAKPACRWSSTRARPTRTPPRSSRKRAGRGLSRSSSTAFRPASTLPAAVLRSAAISPFRASSPSRMPK